MAFPKRFTLAFLTLFFPFVFLNAQPTGFSDGFSDYSLSGWRTEGARIWTVKNEQVMPGDGSNAGFLIGRYPCSDNGKIDVDINADQWNGQEGGVVFRWNSSSSFYYVAVKPGNEWNNAVYLCKNTTNIASGHILSQNFSMPAQFHLTVEINQATIKVCINGVQHGIFTDQTAPLQNGYVGLGHSSAWNSWIKYDNFYWTDESGSTTTLIPTNTTTAINPGDIAIYFKDEGINENNIMKPRWYIQNNGTSPISNFQAFFYFTADPGKTPILEDYYTPDCAVSLEHISDNRYRVTMDYPGITLYPGNITPDHNGSVIGIHYSDWSTMDKGQSFSYAPTQGFVPNGNIPVVLPSSGSGNGPIAGSVPPVTIKTKNVRLINLHCTETEDAAGEDECLLEMYRNEQLVSSFNHDLNDGEDWALNQEFPLAGNMEVRLTDIDGDLPGDDNDFLGSVVINTDVGVHEGSYTSDGANYTLQYEVFENSSVVPGVQQVTVKSLSINTLYCAET